MSVARRDQIDNGRGLESIMQYMKNDKLRISAAAMKVAAKCLSSGGPEAARSAIRGALRHDTPSPVSFPVLGGLRRVDLSARISFVIGSSGSGKSELSFAAVRQASRAGYRTAQIAGDHAIRFRWHDSDAAACDLNAWGPERGADEAVACLNDAKKTHACVSLPWAFMGPTHERLVDALPEILKRAPDEFVVMFDEICWSETSLGRVLEVIRNRPGIRAIFCIQPGMLWRMGSFIRPEDAVILMHHASISACHEPALISLLAAIPDNALIGLRAGEGLLFQGGVAVPIVGDYEFSSRPEPVMSGTRAGRAIEILRASLIADPPKTHASRLEVVARACGYRGWHAARGRSF